MPKAKKTAVHTPQRNRYIFNGNAPKRTTEQRNEFYDMNFLQTPEQLPLGVIKSG
jgi:hypothetical protein